MVVKLIYIKEICSKKRQAHQQNFQLPKKIPAHGNLQKPSATVDFSIVIIILSQMGGCSSSPSAADPVALPPGSPIASLPTTSTPEPTEAPASSEPPAPVVKEKPVKINRFAHLPPSPAGSNVEIRKFAKEGKDLDMVSLFEYDVTAVIDIRDGSNGNTALIWAAEKGNFEIVKLLLSRDPNLDAVNNKGETALMVASFKGFIEIVTALLDAGADINKLNKNNASALKCARLGKKTDIAQLLESRGAQ